MCILTGGYYRCCGLRTHILTINPLVTNSLPRQQKDQKKDGTYDATLEQIGTQIESVQDFWRYNNNTPVENIKMRESIYLFKQGFQPIWEDRRNINGGSWTFRVPKSSGPDFWTRVQLMAIGEKLQSCLDVGKYKIIT
jgi:hypothetical protein